ncbi:MAG: hypothetical protein NPMRTH1_820007 [Nitrosopumilales archaeon]|nr:MAG: hypothetical protein NPMRTH1_820007 [Nitrosopumilales archaeon]
MESSVNQYCTIINFGIRVISNRNSSKTIALPKTALKNLSDGRFSKLSIQLIDENGNKFLKLTPVFDLRRKIL